VSLFFAHAPVERIKRQSENAEAEQIAHKISIRAHPVERPHVAFAQSRNFRFGQIALCQRFLWRSQHGGSEGFVMQQITADAVDTIHTHVASSLLVRRAG